MDRITTRIEDIQSEYDVLVIGSGYGGAIAASRMARAGKKVCVLERGREIVPGEYPDTPLEAAEETQTRLAGGKQIGSRTALFDFRFSKDINVLVGCGLGGTSLINANVSIPPDPRVFDDPHWPQAFKNDVNSLLKSGYERAQAMLQPIPFPTTFQTPDKLKAMEKSAQSLGQEVTRLPINVAFYETPDNINHVGVEQPPCNFCGDCVSGCNVGAKSTTLMNYLPDARNNGAQLFECAEVEYLEQKQDYWIVHFRFLESGQDAFDAPLFTLKASIVMLGAGTLGSTEILLRSKNSGLSLSDKIGERFTGNGDVLGFAYNADSSINGIGYGAKDPEGRDPVGPCITSMIDLRDTADLEDGMIVEEGSLPGAIADLLPAAFATAAKIFGRDTDTGVSDFIQESRRELESLVTGPYRGAIKNTQTYLVMSHDDGDGKMSLDNDALAVRWPKVGEQSVFRRVNDKLTAITKGLGATYMPNPIWNELTDHQLVTVHPLGGCIMAEDANRGVVNHKGQVFSSTGGTEVYENLFVCDGAVIPRSLGVNPLITICAIAERTCELIATDNHWTINYELPSRPPPNPPQRNIGIRFTETMRGHFSTEIKDDYQRAEMRGKKENSPFKFTLTVISNDLDALLTQDAHKARMLGTVNAPVLSDEPCMVTDGEFQLLTENRNSITTRNMLYKMKLNTVAGRQYYFEGYKEIKQDEGLDVWPDTTTLYITLFDGGDASSQIVGKGILHIKPSDFMRQMTTFQVTGAKDKLQRLDAVARFGKFFAGELFDVYGGVFARPKQAFFADAPIRKKRVLRYNTPVIHYVQTKDNVRLRLTRYCGGKKGPVLLTHGLGVSSTIFTTDTIETNLVEYLCANGYDCWLLDYRASIDLSISNTQFTGDDVARFDYPAAVQRVRELTDCDAIDVIAHCFGSTTFTMAMLNGLTGVRSAVCSQVMAHVESPLLTQIKTGLHIPGMLEKLGFDTLTSDAKQKQNWWEDAFDSALKLYPGDFRDNNPVSRRITFLYGSLYELNQLNSTTYNALHELFGVANISTFKHLALMVREGKVVTADGLDTYLPNIKDLAIPITIIHGAENKCYLPRSTELTFNLMREENTHTLYNRHLIPGYGHIDCIFGKDAVRDVYPYILQHLETIN